MNNLKLKVVSTILLALLSYIPKASAGEPCCHLLICCRSTNDGMKFLVNGKWNPAHDYGDINQVSDIMQKIKEAGVRNVIIDMTNASQWTNLWKEFEPMVNNVQKVCRQKNMQFFIFIGADFTEDDKKNINSTPFSFWNAMAKNVWEMWAQDPTYNRYGYGDDRPILIVFQPSEMYWDRYQAAPDSAKTYLSKFHIGTTQVNDPILPGKSNHRADDNSEIYFLINLSDKPVEREISFRAVGKTEKWDSQSGEIQSIKGKTTKNKTIIPTKLKPLESVIYVFIRK